MAINFNFKPNKLGWIVLGCMSFTTFYFGKNIVRQTLEIFDVYDYDLIYLNLIVLIISGLVSYKFLEQQIKNGNNL